jgi:ABC-type Na+ efflux pump permease subunit
MILIRLFPKITSIAGVIVALVIVLTLSVSIGYGYFLIFEKKLISTIKSNLTK